MEFNLLSKIAQILRSQQQRSRWRRVVTCMAAVVVFCTTYALILPAITLTASCGLEEHTHTAACYANDDTLLWLCQQENQAAAVHQHDEACYDENGLLVCGKADFVLHTHDADICYDAEGNLICTLPEITAYSRTTLFLAKAEDSATATTSSSLQFALFIPEGAEDTDSALPDGYVVLDSQEPEAWTEAHTHSADCYDENGKLICGQLEVAQHQHTMDCLQGTLICGLEEHQHSQACYTDAQNADQADQQALTAQVDDATIGVTFPADALPEGVILQAREIAQDSDDYAVYYQQALQAMQNQSETEVTLSFARFFDIAFLADGTEVEPAAPVDVTITYADGIALADNENSSAIHFTDDDIQVLEVQTEGVGDIVDTFTFTQDSFSVTGTVVALSTSSAEAQELEVLVGETIAITGVSANYHSWTSSDNAIATVTAASGSSEKANVTGVAAGTVTITHQYGKNKNNITTETFTVTVVEAMKEAASANFTVKVTGNKNKLPEGVTLMVEEVAANYEEDAYYNAMIDGLNAAGAATTTLQSGSDHAATDFDFLHMYHIWLQQADGEEYVLDENDNLNLNVTITYTDTDTEAPAGWDSLQAKGAWVGHYYKKENGAIAPKSIDDSLEPKQVKVKGSSISFHMKSFSVITMATAAAAGNNSSSTSIGETVTGTTASGRNAWQISTVESYNSLNGARMTKIIEGTEKENVFKVTVTVEREPDIEELQKVFQAAGGQALQSNSQTKEVGTIIDSYSPQSKDTLFLGDDQDNGSIEVTYKTSKGNFTVTMYCAVNANSGTYHGVFVPLPNGNWISVYKGKFDFASGDNIELSSIVDLTLIEEELFEAISPSIDSVTDALDTSRFTYLDGLACTGGTASYDKDTNVITWEGLSGLKADTPVTMSYNVELMANGIAAMGYTTAGPDKTTGKAYPEGKATANITVQSTDVATGETVPSSSSFTVERPSVKSLLYYIRLEKVDSEDSTEKLAGAEFSVYAGEAKNGTAVATITTDKNGIGISTPGLPWGIYTVVETKAPQGYELPEQPTVGTYKLAYLGDGQEGWTAEVVQDTITPGKNVEKAIENTKLSVILKIKKVNNDNIPLQGAEFTLYAKADRTETDRTETDGTETDGTEADETEADETEARTVLYEGLKSDADGILCYAVEGENPVNSFPLQTGTYYLEETKAPDGYHMLTEPVVITINEKGVSAMCGTAQLTVEAPSQEDTSSQDTETTVYTVLVTNSSGTALPETGGYGPEAYQLAGLLLMLIAAGWLWQRLRERGNAHSPKA